MIHGLVRSIRRRIVIKLTLTLVGFVGLCLIAAGLYLNHALEEFAIDSLEGRLVLAGRLLQDDARRALRTDRPAGIAEDLVVRAAASTGARVTLIAPDGRVLAESERSPADLPLLENHASRPEVRAALAGGIGRALRRSATIDTPLLYTGLPVRDAGRIVGVLRLALPLAAVTASYASLHGVMLAGGAVALAVAFGIGVFVAGRVTRPVVEMQSIARQMSEGSFFVRAPARSIDEIGTLGRSLNVLAARLREKIDDLEQERAKLTAVLDGMVEGVIAVDGHEHILIMNERARGLFGLPHQRSERRSFLEVIRSADLHEVFRESRRAAPGALVRRELTVSAPLERVLQVHGVPLALGDSETGVVMVLHDVTELRRLEHVRTEFVANVSHELRTPLTAIHGYVETLLGGALEEPEHARKFLEIVFRQTERLGRLINDLADLSNIELGKVSLRLEPVHLEDVVDSVLGIVAAKAEQGGVRCLVDVPADLPDVRADHDRLVQILLNLVDNAVKYTSSGGEVRISARDSESAGVEVAVADTGIGIPRADLPRITERFYRVDKARSRELGGTGLGLAIVKHLVAAHGGSLSIDSELDRGTTVRFTLPVVTRAAAREA